MSCGASATPAPACGLRVRSVSHWPASSQTTLGVPTHLNVPRGSVNWGYMRAGAVRRGQSPRAVGLAAPRREPRPERRSEPCRANGVDAMMDRAITSPRGHVASGRRRVAARAPSPPSPFNFVRGRETRFAHQRERCVSQRAPISGISLLLRTHLRTHLVHFYHGHGHKIF